MRVSSLAAVLLGLSGLACNKAAPAPEAKAQVAVAPAPAGTTEGAATAEAPASTGSSPSAGTKASCGADCNCKDHSLCGTGACTGCGAKAEGGAEGKPAETCGGAGHAGCGGAEGKDGEAAAKTSCGGAAAAAEDGAAPAEGGCGGHAEAAAGTTAGAEGAAAPAAAQHFGDSFTVEGTTPIDDVLSKAAELDGKNVRVSATITKVCKKKGCWFVLASDKDAATTVRVTMKDYGFFVPVDSDGKKADVEGVLKRVEVPEAARKHLAEDGKEDPSAIQGPAFELSLVATAIDLKS